MRIAVVDIGTNSTRLLIADVDSGRPRDSTKLSVTNFPPQWRKNGHAHDGGATRDTTELVRRTLITRLGAGVDADGRLNREAMDRVYAALDEYRPLIEKHEVDRAVAVLTSAVRDAANGREFADTVHRRYGIVPHVLSGDEEARLTFLGATSERDPRDRTPTLVFDIGGGSTELVIGSGQEMTFHVSTQAGVVRQTERHLHTDPPSAEDMEELREDVRTILTAAVLPEQRRPGDLRDQPRAVVPRDQPRAAVPPDQRHPVDHAIAVAGTATSLAAIAQELEPYDESKVHGYQLARERADAILQRLAALPLEQRRRVKGLHPDRAPTIVAGVIILLQVLRLFDLHEVEISEHDILRGAALRLGEG
jgi:exopolyphosphatase/guanosine-5'-triphosphate,3'-diphosphate pyrophosphatase